MICKEVLKMNGAGAKMIFKADGTFIYSQDGYSFESTWEFNMISSDNIDYTRIRIDAGGFIEYFEEVEISERYFSYVLEYCDSQYDCAIIRNYFR